MSNPMKMLRALLMIGAVAGALVALPACGTEESLDVATGETVEIGGLEYKVIFSRLLNIYSEPDAAYLEGQDPPPADSSYLGVFVQISNESGEDSAPVAEDIHLVDTEGQTFEPLETESVFALELGREIQPGGQVPALNSPAEAGPVGGAVVPFEISDEATENRPLELVIPGAEGDARVELDI